MAENPSRTLTSETFKRLGAGEIEEAGDIWRHEGFKKVVEQGLYLTGSNPMGRLALRNLIGGGPVEDPRLHTNVGGLELEGPVGLAPGWDKTGKTIQAWQALGARHITIGGVTLFPQAGNRMPRLRTMDEQIGDHGVSVSLNSFGFWNPGADKVLYNIQKQKEMGNIKIPIIVQITVNKEFYEAENTEYVYKVVEMAIKKLRPVADAINLGLSSPNTEGMRRGQAVPDFINRITAAARNVAHHEGRYIPIIYKGDGDGGEERLEFYCSLAEFRELDFDAFELINTTALPHIKACYGVEDIPGGLAGTDPEYQEMVLKAVRYVYEHVGNRFDIIGTGGVDSPQQALKMIEAGASAIGINTAVRKLGLGVMRFVEGGLLNEIDQKYPQVTALNEIVGTSTKRGAKYLSREDPSDKIQNASRRLARGMQREVID
jgi:dihydroorotate dehydrogenase